MGTLVLMSLFGSTICSHTHVALQLTLPLISRFSTNPRDLANVYGTTLDVGMQNMIKFQREMYSTDIDKGRFNGYMDPNGITEIHFRQVFGTGIYSMSLFVRNYSNNLLSSAA